MIFYLFIVLLVIYLYRYYKDHYFYWRNQGVPVLFPIPIINDYYYHFMHTMHDGNLRCLKRYGPMWVQFMMSTNQEVFIADPELIKEILIKNFRQFNGRNDNTIFAKYFQKVMFMRDETNGWKHIRQTVSPLFTTGKLKALYSNLNKPMINLIENIDKKMGDNHYLDNFDPLLNFKSLFWNVSLNLFFSVKLNSFQIESDDFVKKCLSAKPDSDFGNIMALITPEWIVRLLKIIPMNKNTYDYLVQLSLNTIQQRKKDTQSNYNDLLQLLIQTDLPDDEIVAQCISLFLGGFESVSSTCTFALYELALQPDIQDKLYSELSTYFPELDESLEIDFEKIHSSPYLEAFIKELLRRHLAISKIFRRALVDCELNGIKIQKNTFISIPVYAIHHNEKYWPNPMKFDPNRFLNKEPESCTYLPFSEGSRQCIAKRLAELQLRYCLITFLRRYEIYRTELTKNPLEYKKFTFLFSCEDVFVGIRKRN